MIRFNVSPWLSRQVTGCISLGFFRAASYFGGCPWRSLTRAARLREASFMVDRVACQSLAQTSSISCSASPSRNPQAGTWTDASTSPHISDASCLLPLAGCRIAGAKLAWPSLPLRSRHSTPVSNLDGSLFRDTCLACISPASPTYHAEETWRIQLEARMGLRDGDGDAQTRHVADLEMMSCRHISPSIRGGHLPISLPRLSRSLVVPSLRLGSHFPFLLVSFIFSFMTAGQCICFYTFLKHPVPTATLRNTQLGLV
jgi:hypothetical protein